MGIPDIDGQEDQSLEELLANITDEDIAAAEKAFREKNGSGGADDEPDGRTLEELLANITDEELAAAEEQFHNRSGIGWTIQSDPSLFRPWAAPPSFVAGAKAASIKMLGQSAGTSLANEIQSQSAGGTQAFPEPSKGVKVDKTGEIFVDGKSLSEMTQVEKGIALAKANNELRAEKVRLSAKRLAQRNTAMDPTLKTDVRGYSGRGVASTTKQINENDARLDKVLAAQQEFLAG